MNKNSHYNQQTEAKQRKSEFEEICIHQNLETGHFNMNVNSGFRARNNPSEATVPE